MTLEESVNKAVAENPPTEPVVETKEPEKVIETKQEQETPEQVAYREKVDKAVRLFDALSDPNIGRTVVEDLARKAGVIGVQEGKTEKQITKSVVDTLKESLGPEYEFLADRLATGLDKIVKQTVQEQLVPIQTKTDEAMERAIVADIDAAYARAEARHKDFKDFDKDMMELSKELPYTGNSTEQFDRYLERLYKLASADKQEAKTIKRTVDKINKNAQEIRDSSTEVQETRVKTGSKLPSLNEAIAAAARGERFV